jgi:hypothetical protein
MKTKVALAVLLMVVLLSTIGCGVTRNISGDSNKVISNQNVILLNFESWPPTPCRMPGSSVGVVLSRTTYGGVELIQVEPEGARCSGWALPSEFGQ